MHLIFFFLFPIESFVNLIFSDIIMALGRIFFFSFILLIFEVFCLQVVEGVGEPAKRQFYGWLGGVHSVSDTLNRGSQ